MINYYEKSNKELWNKITATHVKAYDIQPFKQGKTTLDEIQRGELGNDKGKTLLHLQCRFGLDNLSWAREGAIVTGIDFAEGVIFEANKLKEELDISAELFPLISIIFENTLVINLILFIHQKES